MWNYSPKDRSPALRLCLEVVNKLLTVAAAPSMIVRGGWKISKIAVIIPSRLTINTDIFNALPIKHTADTIHNVKVMRKTGYVKGEGQLIIVKAEHRRCHLHQYLVFCL